MEDQEASFQEPVPDVCEALLLHISHFKVKY